MRNVFFKQSANAIMLLAFAAGSVMTSCKKSDPAPAVVPNNEKTITQIVVDSPDFSFLKAAVIKAGLDVALGATPATLTVFAPTNAAFIAAGFATEAAVTAADKLVLEGILKNHVLPTNRAASSLLNGDVITNNLAAKPLTVSSAGITVIINESKVTSADLIAKNGRIHTVDKVILPRTSILGAAVANADLTSLVAAVVNVSKNTPTNVAALLNGPTTTKLTVFAPNNAAFLAANPAFTPAFLGDAANAAAVLSILTYHVLAGAVPAASVPAGPNALVPTFDGLRNVFATRNAAGVFINGTKVITADVAADNGVVHVIERALVPATTTLAGFVTADARFSCLLSAILYADANTTPSAGLATLLGAGGPFTVFAPVNSAFAFLNTNGNTTLENSELVGVGGPVLADIIRRHVVLNTRAFSSDLSNGQIIPTANGTITINISAAGAVTVKANTTPASAITATVAVTNVLATNGVAHAITEVLR